MKTKSSQFLFTLGYCAYFLLLALLSGIVFRGVFAILLWLVGGLVGVLLPRVMDIGLLLFGQKNHTNVRQIAKDFKQKFFLQQDTASVVPQSPLRSYPFLFGYALATFYVLTSTQPIFGKAVLLGVGLSLVGDLLLHRQPKEELRRRWFRLFPTNLTDQELDIFIGVCVVGFGVLSLLGAQA